MGCTRARKVTGSYFEGREAFPVLAPSRLRPDVQAGASLAGKDSSEASSTTSNASPCGDVLFPSGLRVTFLPDFDGEERIGTAPLANQVVTAQLQGNIQRRWAAPKLQNQPNIESLLSLSTETLPFIARTCKQCLLRILGCTASRRRAECPPCLPPTFCLGFSLWPFYWV